VEKETPLMHAKSGNSENQNASTYKKASQALSTNTKALLAVLAVAGGLYFLNQQQPAKAQGTNLNAKATEIAWSDFTENRFLSHNGNYYTHFSIPPKTDQDKPVSRIIEAKGVYPYTTPRVLSSTDSSSGIEWQGTIKILASAAREYDPSVGWKEWVDHPTLMIYQVERKNGAWRSSYHTALQVPANVVFQKLKDEEVPSENAGPMVCKPFGNAGLIKCEEQSSN
jgi:hypothetical protein